jgi:hypothetical protein
MSRARSASVTECLQSGHSSTVECGRSARSRSAPRAPLCAALRPPNTAVTGRVIVATAPAGGRICGGMPGRKCRSPPDAPSQVEVRPRAVGQLGRFPHARPGPTRCTVIGVNFVGGFADMRIATVNSTAMAADNAYLIGWLALSISVLVVSVALVVVARSHARPFLSRLLCWEGAIVHVSWAQLTGRPCHIEELPDSTVPAGSFSSEIAVVEQGVERLAGRVTNLREIDHASAEVTRLLATVREVITAVESRTDSLLATLVATAETRAASGVRAPASVYTSADDGTQLKDAVAHVLLAFELLIVAEEAVERGSWFQRFWVRMIESESRG